MWCLGIFRLKIELVPSPLWGKTLAKRLPSRVWYAIKRSIMKTRGEKCEFCGHEGRKLMLHEAYAYDDKQLVQKLTDLKLICQDCHDVKHIGRSMQVYDNERILYLREHFCKVNQCGIKDFDRHLKEEYLAWLRRSNRKWKQDSTSLAELLGIDQVTMPRYGEKGEPPIYFSHPMPLYGTKREKEEIRQITRNFPGSGIVNPAPFDRNPLKMIEGMKFCFRLIDACSAIVFSRFNGVITAGVGSEVNYALENKKKVYELKDGVLIPVTKEVKYLSREETRRIYRTTKKPT